MADAFRRRYPAQVGRRPSFWPVELSARQHLKRLILAPTVAHEILIQGKNVSGPKLVRQPNQAGIREINPPVLIDGDHGRRSNSALAFKQKSPSARAGAPWFRVSSVPDGSSLESFLSV